ncbi:hypothetical protein MSAN_01112600 [Mycena sanguinolenta]|uniref:Uncharacterized protein n=1 Tax=Mycena sanguinolenta TaxID=230812 RepID=A0A8H6YJ87_9AGAR|nr:hypothetical protein MSAN_01112600 [Mycena sanguinolenta]
MPLAKSAATKLLESKFPPPKVDDCPQDYFHKVTIHHATRGAKDPARFCAYDRTCHPPKKASAEQKAKRSEYEEFKRNNPVKRKARVPKKKSPLQLVLDDVVAAFNAGFPDGHSAPLTAEASQAIDKALAALNSFYPVINSMVSSKASGGKAAGPAVLSKSSSSKAAVAGSSVANSSSRNKEKAKGDARIIAAAPGATTMAPSSARERTRQKFLEDEKSNIQADAYDSDMYAIDPSERALIRVVIYKDANEEPFEQQLRRRCKSDFDFKWFHIAKVVRAVPDGDQDTQECVAYHRYSLSDLDFTAERVLDTISLANRGDIVIYRATNLRNEQCPGINEWISKALDSAFSGGVEDDESEDDESEDEVPIAGPSSASTPRTLKRKYSSVDKGKGREGFSSKWLEAEARLFEEEEEEDRRFRRRFMRELEDGEEVLVLDSDDEKYLQSMC